MASRLKSLVLIPPLPLLWRAVDALIYAVNRCRTVARLHRMFPGRTVNCDVTTVFKYPENIICGNHILIGPYASIGAMAQVVLEDYVRISRGVTIETATLAINEALPYPHTAKPIHIERGAWIGTNAVILGGVRIGAKAVVAAGAVVTKNVPPGAIVAGIPARNIKNGQDAVKG